MSELLPASRRPGEHHETGRRGQRGDDLAGGAPTTVEVPCVLGRERRHPREGRARDDVLELRPRTEDRAHRDHERLAHPYVAVPLGQDPDDAVVGHDGTAAVTGPRELPRIGAAFDEHPAVGEHVAEHTARVGAVGAARGKPNARTVFPRRLVVDERHGTPAWCAGGRTGGPPGRRRRRPSAGAAASGRPSPRARRAARSPVGRGGPFVLGPPRARAVPHARAATCAQVSTSPG